MDDNAILKLFLLRDEEALLETRLKYGARLYRVAMNILHSHEDAEECVNDALLKAWDAVATVMPQQLGAYLAKIVRNLALHRWEAKAAAKRGGGTVHLLLDELEDCIPTTSGPEEAYEAGLLTEAINSCLSAMKTAMRTAFVLRYFHGESIAGVAGRMEMSESKTKSMLHRARKKLAEHLEKEGINI